MVRYRFKLKRSYTPPDLACETEKDKLYGGINLLYSIREISYFKLFGKYIPYYSKLLGTKVFLNPYKKYWNKKEYRIPHVYWGKVKHPLTRMWMIPINTFPLVGNKKIIPEATLNHYHVKVFERNFRSKDIATHLFKQDHIFSICKQSKLQSNGKK